METGRRILIVEDEPAIADSLIYVLRTEGFEPVHCATGGEAWAALTGPAAAAVVLVILDVGLPDDHGFDFCRRARAAGLTVPILFLTARQAEVDRIVGLEIGGDDYVTKPFSPREVGARVRAILRRGGNGIGGGKGAGGGNGEAGAPGKATEGATGRGLQIDPEAWTAAWDGRRLALTRYEFRLLAVLRARPGRVYSRDALMQAVWEDPGASLDRTVDAHVKTLRAKLREVAGEAELIRTHRGVGYSWSGGA